MSRACPSLIVLEVALPLGGTSTWVQFQSSEGEGCLLEFSGGKNLISQVAIPLPMGSICFSLINSSFLLTVVICYHFTQKNHLISLLYLLLGKDILTIFKLVTQCGSIVSLPYRMKNPTSEPILEKSG